MFSVKVFVKEFENIKKRLLLRNIDAREFDKCKESLEKLQDIRVKIVDLNREKNSLIKENKSIYYSRIKDIKKELSLLSEKEKEYSSIFDSLIYTFPNLPDESLTANCEIIRSSGFKRVFDFIPLSHWELGETNNLFNQSMGASISGSGFVVYTDLGAKLLQALIEYTLVENEKKGYKRYFLPVVVNQNTLFGTAQLPKFESDLFKVSKDKYLSPTSETQLVNLYKNKIIEKDSLPIKLTANTNCFRLEAGGAGSDTRGIMRLHQFNKTEIVVIAEPIDSFNWLEKMVNHASDLLEKLNLPYRIVQLPYDDLSFASTKTYDIEVWFPSEGRYREISSVSNTLDFQARRSKIRYKKNLMDSEEKTKYPHILNASSLAIDRLFAAILENYQNSDGSINVPEILQSYLNFKVIKN